MATVLITHAIENYDEWKPGFDAHAETRHEYGSRGYRLFRGTDDPNDITMLFEWDSVENARRFLEESDVRERMDELGVIGDPDITFVEEVESRSSETPMP